MSVFFQDAKEQLSKGFFRESIHEIEALEKLLSAAGSEKTLLARWEYAENKTGFVEPRSAAGLIFYQDDQEAFWEVTERLIGSEDPDNRDTALTTLGSIHDPRKYALMKLLLDDPYFYIQFEAIEQLIEQFPSEVLELLNRLAQSENPQYRMLALEKLNMLKRE